MWYNSYQRVLIPRRGACSLASGGKKSEIELNQEAQQVREAAAAAKEEVLSRKVLETLLKVKPEDLISPDAEAEVIKGNANRSGCWVHAPAMMEFFAAADKRLTRVANWSGMHVNQVEKVQAQLIKGTKLIIIKPAPVDDLTAIPINRYANAAMFNLVTLLAETGLKVQTGYRERFDVAYVPKESPLWPALLIDMGKLKERRMQPVSKKEESGQQSQAKGTAKQKNKAEAADKEKAKATTRADRPESAPARPAQGGQKKKQQKEDKASETGAK